MCVDDKCNLEKTSFINCTGHPIKHKKTQHKLGVAFSYLERNEKNVDPIKNGRNRFQYFPSFVSVK